MNGLKPIQIQGEKKWKMKGWVRGKIFYLQDVLQLTTDINIFLVVVDLRIMGNEGILWANVDGVVDLPVDISDLPGWMEETL